MQNDVRNKEYLFQSTKNDIFFISDPHFGHQNILKYCNRPFKSTDEMNEFIINRWNLLVKEDDIVFILGDIAFGGAGLFDKIVPRLNGQKYLILGNHDYKNMREKYREYFVKVSTKMFISIDGQPIILNHEPLLCFGGQMDNRIWHLFGHVHTSHGTQQGSDYKRVKYLSTPTMYDVGVDFNEYIPVRYQIIKAHIEKQKKTGLNFIELEQYNTASKLGKWIIKLRRKIINYFL